MEREVGVCRTEARDKMILKGSDGSLGRVPTMDVRRSELKINFLGGHVLLEGG